MDLVYTSLAFLAGLGVYNVFKNTNHEKRAGRLERINSKLRNQIEQNEMIITSMRKRRNRRSDLLFNTTMSSKITALANNNVDDVIDTHEKTVLVDRIHRYYQLFHDILNFNSKNVYNSKVNDAHSDSTARHPKMNDVHSDSNARHSNSKPKDIYRGPMIHSVSTATRFYHGLLNIFGYHVYHSRETLYDMGYSQLETIACEWYRTCYSLNGATFNLYGATFGISALEISLYYIVFFETFIKKMYPGAVEHVSRYTTEFQMFLYNAYMENNLKSRSSTSMDRQSLLDHFFKESTTLDTQITSLQDTLELFSETISFEKYNLKNFKLMFEEERRRADRLEELLRLECRNENLDTNDALETGNVHNNDGDSIDGEFVGENL